MTYLSKNFFKKVALCSVLISVLTTGTTRNVFAQITPDNSLGGQSSIVNPSGIVQEQPAIIIQGGARVENNLFHSLREFNIGNGERVYFANPAGIQNILTRVTEAQSLIDGTLGVDGTANLFLINPRGIIFGGNARLDIQGSFLASTADSIVFENGLKYSAVNPETPLLTMRVPVGLQFGQNVAAINVAGTGHNITTDDIGAFLTDQRTEGLKVPSQQNLALIGGNVDLNGGNLTAPGGQIHLGSVSGEGFVGLNLTPQNWQFDYSNIQSFGDISLANAASADVTGGSGKIDVRAGNLLLSDGSGLFALTETDQDFGKINIDVKNTISISGISADNAVPSGVFTETTSSNPAGNIDIVTGDLMITQQGQISSSTYGEGKGGDITIKARNSIETRQEIEEYVFVTGIFANSDVSTGIAGNITIETGRLVVEDLAEISTTAYSTADVINPQALGGQLTINASEIEIKDTGTGIFAKTYGTQNSGNIIINAGRLTVSNGAQVNASSAINTYLSEEDNPYEIQYGNAGNIEVNAREIELTGKGESPSGSSILALTITSGNAGNLTINTQQFLIKNGATLTVSGRQPTTRELEYLKQEWQELPTNYQIGNAGILTINANDIRLINGAIRGEAVSGKGANITINTNTLVGLNNSDISAIAGEPGNFNQPGEGGKIEISYQGLFGLQPITRNQALNRTNGSFNLSEINSNDIAAFSVTNPNLNGQIIFNSPEVDPTTGAIKTPQNPAPIPQIARGCEAQPGQNTSSFINTGTGGLPPNPSTPYLGVSAWQDPNSQPLQNTQLIPTQTNSNQIREAQGFEWANANKTRIRLTANSRNVTPSSSWQIPGNCYGK
ncbi:filamentous hemagglutinin N-terminal domain-containing protein [Ancylothrix sp. C2]|uniref:two-partner secretion domain-containing protein n=1 Tax=Ancylothrix sp. D3o TaxID=2953691 RepID=UPI0021BB6E6D|nr:filamentous hemagglutinin N-terminal domain-containing protein [Ancylothrix sp. D3o]MCT7952731.1 filamentous hemagglutinin N-terminal domain-containing protein [Ancylothrix sp. D3o]